MRRSPAVPGPSGSTLRLPLAIVLAPCLLTACFRPLDSAPVDREQGVPDASFDAAPVSDAGADAAVGHEACASALPLVLPVAPGERATPMRGFDPAQCRSAEAPVACDRDLACPSPVDCDSADLSSRGLCLSESDCVSGVPVGHAAGACVSCVSQPDRLAACCAATPGFDCRSFPLAPMVRRSSPGELCSLHGDCEPGLLCGAPASEPWGAGMGRCMCPGVSPEHVENRPECSTPSAPAAWGEPARPLAAACTPGIAKGWVVERVNDQASSFRAAIGPDGTLHVLHALDELWHSVRTSAGWQAEQIAHGGIDSHDEAPAAQLALRIDAQGHVHGLVTNHAFGNAPTYVSNASGSFASEPVGDTLGASAPAIAIDADGALHLGYEDDNDYNLHYVTGTSGSFHEGLLSTSYASSMELLFVNEVLTWVYAGNNAAIQVAVQADGALEAQQIETGTPLRAATWGDELRVVFSHERTQGTRVGLVRVKDGNAASELVWAQDDSRHAVLGAAPSLAIDDQGNTLIVHASPEGLMLARSQAAGFASERIAAEAVAADLLLDAAGEPHVLYTVPLWGGWELRHAFRGSCPRARVSP
jgi:hypothetical protein